MILEYLGAQLKLYPNHTHFPNSWVQYNSVDFGSKKIKSVEIKAKSVTGGIIQIHLDKINGPLVGEVKILKGDLKSFEAKVSKAQNGVHNLFVVLKDSPVELDWVKFKN